MAGRTAPPEKRRDGQQTGASQHQRTRDRVPEQRTFSLLYVSVEKRLAASLFLAETGQASSLQMGSAARRAILLHQKILGKLTAPKSFRRGCRGSLQPSRTDRRELGRHQRRGVDLVPGFSWGAFLAGIKRGRCWVKLAVSLLSAEVQARVYWLALTGFRWRCSSARNASSSSALPDRSNSSSESSASVAALPVWFRSTALATRDRGEVSS